MKACSIVGNFKKKTTAKKAMAAKRAGGAKGLKLQKAKKGYKLVHCQ